MATSDTTFTFTITAKQKKVCEVIEEDILEHLKKVCESRINHLDSRAKDFVDSQSAPVSTRDEVVAAGTKSALERRLEQEAADEAAKVAASAPTEPEDTAV